MPYTESMFLMVMLLAFVGIERRWPLVAIAAIVGLATAVRPVGVALVVPLAWHTLQRAKDRRWGLAHLAWVLPLGCWGLLAYMLYLQLEFGDALAFAKTQEHWRQRVVLGWDEKLLSLASWEPIWSVYVPGAPGYFGGFQDWENVFGRMRFWNPVFFVGTAVLVGVGAWKRWLSTNEVLVSVFLLAIPYVTRSYEMCMESHGRFAAVVFPAYMVLGQLLARLPWPVAWGILALCGVGLFWFTAQYAAGRPFF